MVGTQSVNSDSGEFRRSSLPDNLAEQWVCFPSRSESNGKVALIVDSSEAADDHWEDTVGLVRAVIDNLSADAREGATVYMLGSSAGYSPGDFCQNAASLRNKHRSRLRLIRPICEQWRQRTGIMALVFAAGRIFDLDDWLESPMTPHTMQFVRFGKIALTDDPLCHPEQGESVMPQVLSERLDRCWERVELSGIGMRPFFWDNMNYQWDGKRLFTTVREDVTVRVGFFHPQGTEVYLSATSGTQQAFALALQPCEPLSPQKWRDLDNAETKVFRHFVDREEFDCLLCHERHPADTVLCPTRRNILLDPVYPSLWNHRGSESGFVILGDFGDCVVKVHHHRCPALRLAGGTVAYRSRGQIEMHRFDAASPQYWRISRENQGQYFHVEGKIYALAL